MPRSSRRGFLKTTAALAGAVMPYWSTTQSSRALGFSLVNDRPVLGCIGTGDRWAGGIIQGASKFFDCVAACDVDKAHLESGKKKAGEELEKQGRPVDITTYEDYRAVLDRKDVQVVTIVTPDHWHSKIAIEAMQAGKDVYCEKPLTLTIHEGKQIIKVLEETKRVFQVGTQQRSEMGNRFLKAVAMVRSGRIGKVQKVTCNIGGAPSCEPLPVAPVPSDLNWDMWLGQAPMVEYRQQTIVEEEGKRRPKYPHSRTHYEFRWWYEYSGGKMTDWGAHHVDIAAWALGMENAGPISIEGTAKHPVEYRDGWPVESDRYNVATAFDIKVMCPNDVELRIVHDSPDGNGILFEGTEGRFHVSRERMKGRPADELAENPLDDSLLTELYKGKQFGDHMRNFAECMVDRTQPISDVWTHHRAMSICHLANIAIRLGRKIEWDAVAQQIKNDPAANQWLSREQRKGYEINVSV